MKKIYYIGIDIGGSNIKGILRCSNKIIKQIKTKTPNDNIANFKNVLFKIIDELRKGHKISGIGIGVCGRVENGTVIDAPNLKIIDDYKIKNIISQKYKCFVKVCNDSHLFYYALKNTIRDKNIAFITLGTGMGISLYINGKLHTKTDFSSDFSHTKFFHSDCSIEDKISKRFLLNKAKKMDLDVHSTSELLSFKNESKIIFEEFGRNLGIVLFSLSKTLKLNKIYITGGFLKSLNLFEKSLMQHFNNPKCKIEFIQKDFPIGAYGGSLMID